MQKGAPGSLLFLGGDIILPERLPMTNMPPLAIVLATSTFFLVLALIAYRLLWSAPFLAAKLGVLPKSWQRWIFDQQNVKQSN
jgi:hypothetical protein